MTRLVLVEDLHWKTWVTRGGSGPAVEQENGLVNLGVHKCQLNKDDESKLLEQNKIELDI